jgi:O-antigen ligase
MLIPVGLTFFASLATLSRAAIMLAFSILGFWFLYLCLSLFTRQKNIKRIKLHLWMIVGVVFTVVLISVFAPKEFSAEVTTLSPTSVADRMTGKAQYHTRVATEIFKDYPLFGVGGWGYKHFCLGYMTDSERRQLQTVGGVNVHNDYLQILCEHGIVGGLLLVAAVFMLFLPLFGYWGRTIKIAHFTKGKDLPKPTALFCVPAVVVGVLIASAANLVHAFGDCVFRSPAVLSQFLLLLAAVEGFLSDSKEA